MAIATSMVGMAVLEIASGWRGILTALFVFVGSTHAVIAQGTSHWQAGLGYPGVNYTVIAMVNWDPDGPGPATPVLVLGGLFSTAGNVAAANIAIHDPVAGTWSALGAGIQPGASLWSGYYVSSLVVLPNGDLVAAGSFTTAGGVAANNIARWDGNSWSALGAGTNGTIHTASVRSNGDLLVGGTFSSAGGAPANNVARWSAGSWAPLGNGLAGHVLKSAVMPNGDWLVAGPFAGYVARWNGSTWSVLGAGPMSQPNAISVMPNGDVVAGGSSYGTSAALVRWNGTTWAPFPGVGIGTITALAQLASGELVIAGTVNVFGVPMGVARWNGTSWSALPGPGYITTIVESSAGALIAGLAYPGYDAGSGVTRWTGSAWVPLVAGTDGAVRALVPLPGGGLAAGGDFARLLGVPARNVAIRSGTAWSNLGGGPGSSILALAASQTGELFAGGYSGQTAAVHRWNGAAWSLMGTGSWCGPEGCWAWVTAMHTRPNGDLIVGGGFSQWNALQTGGLVRWDGTAWSVVAPGYVFAAYALLTAANGDLIIGGYIAPPGGPNHMIARWNGTSVVGFGGVGAYQTVAAVAELPNGDLVAGGDFLSIGGVAANRIARWDGATWSPMGAGVDRRVTALAALPNGDVIAGGDFTTAGGIGASYIARWNGASWSAVDGGMDSSVSVLTLLPSGEAMAGGFFNLAGGRVSSHIARLLPTNPATATPYGTGCTGSAGPVSLMATQLPWLAADFVAQVHAVPATAFAIAGIGFAPTVGPLSTVLPTALPGCSLSVTIAWIELLSPANGTAVARIAVPNAPMLVGQVFFAQAFALEMSGAGVLLASTARMHCN